jgi:hypothetical protein
VANVPGHNVANVRQQNGDWEIQGTINIDKTNGGALTIDGADVSAGLEEVAVLSGLTATAAELNELDDVTSLAQSTVAVAAEAGDAIAVTVTLKDAAGVAVDEARVVNCWLSSSATTGAVASDDTITVTATTGSILVEHTDDLIFKCVTSTAGVLVLSVAHAGNATAKYLWVEFPNGKCKVSAVIDLA